jgi:hypothetical protein
MLWNYFAKAYTYISKYKIFVNSKGSEEHSKKLEEIIEIEDWWKGAVCRNHEEKLLTYFIRRNRSS